MRILGKAVFAVLASLSGLAQAQTPTPPVTQIITFEDVVGWPDGDYPGVYGEFGSGGYNFDLRGESATVIRGDVQRCGPGCPLPGSHYVLAPGAQYGPLPVFTMSAPGNVPFTFRGFDGAGTYAFPSPYTNYIPDQFDVVGTRADGSTVTQSFAINKTLNDDGLLTFTTYQANANFTNLVSLRFTTSGTPDPLRNGFSIDNIVVGAVPEPETYALMLLGLAGVAALARRRSVRNR